MNYKINLEIPTPWCNHQLVGGMVKNMTKNLIHALDRIGLEYQCYDYTVNNDIIYNAADDETVVLLYHKKGRIKNTWYIKESAIPNYFSIDQVVMRDGLIFQRENLLIKIFVVLVCMLIF